MNEEKKKVPSLYEWREDLARQEQRGAALLAFALEKGFDPEKTSIRTAWWPPSLDISVHGGDLAGFQAAVRETTTILGRAPDKCEAKHWHGFYEKGQVPDLVAKWEEGLETVGQKFAVYVRFWSPKGCRLDPRTADLEPVKLVGDLPAPQIHPECRHAIDELVVELEGKEEV